MVLEDTYLLPQVGNAAPTGVRAKAVPVRRLTLLALVAATFFMVAGGPYGLEEVIKNSGYAWAVLFLVVTPVIWSLPTGLMVSELSSALPVEGGYYVWVRRAMGRFWGFQEAWLSLAASVFDMALYPKMFVEYLGHMGIDLGAGTTAWAIGIGVIAVCAVVNILGIRVVGGSSVVMNVVLLLPFVALVVLAFLQDPAPARERPEPGFDLIVGGLLFAMWNYMGWDNATTIAGEVARPQRTYPLAMLGAAVLIIVSYVVPVLAVARTGMAPGEWETGAWVKAGEVVGGARLMIAIGVGGMISALGMFNALVMSYSRLPAVLATDGYLPAIFKRCHPRTGAPWVSILACSVAWAAALQLSLERILALDIIIYGLSLLLEFLALIVLRVREPELPRPFRVPGGMVGAIALAIGPAVLIGLGIYHERAEVVKPWEINALVLSGILVALGPVLYFASPLWSNKAVRS